MGMWGTMFATEVAITRFLLSGAAIALDGAIATVTLAAHLNTAVGQQVTFSGVTGVTGLNNQTWTISEITSTSVYKFPCLLTGSPAGTIVQEPVFTLPAGFNFLTLGANALCDYNPDNLYNAITASGETWRTLIAASANGMVYSDGYGVRMRCSGTTATSRYSQVA